MAQRLSDEQSSRCTTAATELGLNFEASDEALRISGMLLGEEFESALPIGQMVDVDDMLNVWLHGVREAVASINRMAAEPNVDDKFNAVLTTAINGGE